MPPVTRCRCRPRPAGAEIMCMSGSTQRLSAEKRPSSGVIQNWIWGPITPHCSETGVSEEMERPIFPTIFAHFCRIVRRQGNLMGKAASPK